MSFQDAVRVCLRKYADFHGRARRSEYWWFVVFTAVVTTVASVADAGFDTHQWMQGFATAVLLLPSLAVGARRLHDVGKSGWLLLMLLVPILGALLLIWFYFIQDSEPENKYGPSPKRSIGVAPTI